MSDAQRTLPAGRRAPRTALLHALTAGALDRALDVAAALEVRGYGSVRRAPRVRRALSRHDRAFAAAALALLAAAAAARVAGLPLLSDERTAGLGGYGPLAFGVGGVEVALAAAVPVLALAPFLDRRGIVR
jgi:energy-coupling factor transport system permease protein